LFRAFRAPVSPITNKRESYAPHRPSNLFGSKVPEPLQLGDPMA
jgi:hypothetical protein